MNFLKKTALTGIASLGMLACNSNAALIDNALIYNRTDRPNETFMKWDFERTNETEELNWASYNLSFNEVGGRYLGNMDGMTIKIGNPNVTPNYDVLGGFAEITNFMNQWDRSKDLEIIIQNNFNGHDTAFQYNPVKCTVESGMVLNANSYSPSVPEPATLGLLGLGGAIALRKRRK